MYAVKRCDQIAICCLAAALLEKHDISRFFRISDRVAMKFGKKQLRI